MNIDDILYNGGYGYSSMNGTYIWLIISAVIAVIGGCALYFIFTNKEFSGKFKGISKKAVEYLTFEKGILLPILKVSYLIITIYVTLSSFALIGQNFVSFLVMLVAGNVAVRVGYEMALLIVGLAADVKEIKKGLKK